MPRLPLPARRSNRPSTAAALAVACLIVTIVWGVASGADGARPRVVVAATADSVAVTVDGKVFTTLHAGQEARKPYLHPLLTASGKGVTRAFPMEKVAGESTDLPHQRGVWIGTERLSGMDFWENEPSYDRPNKGTIRFTGVDNIRSGADEGRFTMHADWISPAGDTVLVETRTMTAHAKPDNQRMLDIDLSLTAKRESTFEDNHDAILGLRLGTAFEEKHGGHAVNAEGLTGWERLRGARSAWVDWHADLDGEPVGVAVMDAPTNFRFPTPWHVRDYALLFASPFASRDYSPTAPDGSLTLKPGETLRLRYRILVHPAHVDVAAAFKEFAQP